MLTVTLVLVPTGLATATDLDLITVRVPTSTYMRDAVVDTDVVITMILDAALVPALALALVEVARTMKSILSR